MSVRQPLQTQALAFRPTPKDEVEVLIANLMAAESRLEELTAGEVDSVSDGERRTLLLRRAQDWMRLQLAARHAAVLDALPLHIALIDGQGVIVSVNSTWTAFADANSGQGARVGVGANYLEACDRAVGEDAAVAARVAAGIRSILDRTAAVFTLEYPCHSATEQRWFQLGASPVTVGGSASAVIMHLDITQRRLAADKLKESEARFRQLAESIPDAFFLREAEGPRMLYVNPAYEEIWGRSRERLYTDPAAWAEGIHDDDRARIARAVDICPSGEFQLEFRVVRPDASVRWVSVRGYPVLDEDGKRVRIAGIAKDVTEQRLASELLTESQQRLALATASANIGIWDLDLARSQLYCDAKMCALYGRPEQEYTGDYATWQQCLHPEDRGRVECAFAEDLESGTGVHIEFRILWPNGEVRFIESRSQVRRDASGAPKRIVGVNLDITERKQAELSLKQLSRVQATLSAINGLIVRVRDQAELFERACSIAIESGGFRMAMIGMLTPGGDEILPVATAGKGPELLAGIRKLLESRGRAQETMLMQAIRERAAVVANDSLHDPRLQLGAHYALAGVRSLAVFPLLVAGSAVGVFALYASERDFFHDAELKLLKELADDIAFAIDYIDKSRRLDHLAIYDALTSLPNTALFKDRLGNFIQAARQEQMQVCVLVLDLERFTQINDSCGRTVGDELLRAVAARFSENLSQHCALGRIGADTFAFASPSASQFAATHLRDCVHAALTQAFTIGGREIKVFAQAGIAVFPTDGDDSETLFSNAESALKLAKNTGARTTYFSRKLGAEVAARFALEQELRGALEAGQFLLHYQPRVDMISGELIGAEALIRWQHPGRGEVVPIEFIALAEETGLIVPIGTWVLETVCAQQAAWVAAGLKVVPIAINLSTCQFADGDLVQTVARALTTHALDPRLLVLEMTETAVMNDPEAAAVDLHALRKIGVGLALDDFGTGYSSLAHLKRFPFDSVKIDRSFITDITNSPGDAAIASAVIAMAHALNLKVVAEGVETQGQFNFLKTKACDEMQGFLFAPGAPTATFEGQLRFRTKLMVPTPTPADQRTLLIVDDEIGIRAALTRMLRPDGYRILHADSGQAGLDLLAVNEVQVIISDQRMPGMTGTEFLSKVSRLYPNTVRIILSGFTDLKVVTDAVNRGSVFKFLTKPWDDDDLRERVRDAFRRYLA